MRIITTTALTALLCIGFPLAGFTAAEEVIEASPGERLEVDLETGGTVEISGWDQNQVSVESEATGGDANRQRIKIRRSEDGVKVTTELTGHGRHHSSGYRIIIRVPRRFDIEVDSMGGDIHIDNVEGTIEGETMGGELELSNLTGELEMETMGGDIRLTNSEVDGEVTTMGGEVLLENVVGDINGSSMGGDVIYRNVTRRDGTATGDAVIITTMGGDIELSEAMAGAKLETMGGDIELDRAAEYVEAETMGGDIELREVDGRVTATTMGGDIEVRIVGDPQARDRDISLESMSGEVTLTVPRNFAMDVDIELVYTKGHREKHEIVSDADLQISESEDWDRDRGSPRKTIYGKGSFNGGGNKVKIRTINGNVYLRYAG